MHEDLLRWFFNENGLDKDAAPPAAALEHFHIKLFLENVPMQNIIDQTLRDKLPGRDAEVQKEKNEIESATTCDQVIKHLRRGADVLNQQILVRKALDFEDEIVPIIITMLKTSLNDLFIEVSTRILAVCSKDIAEELVEDYDNVRNPYAKSLILLALGFKADEKRIPWLVKKFNELKASHPKESFCYGAYYALLEMDSRFYLESRKFRSQLPVEDVQ